MNNQEEQREGQIQPEETASRQLPLGPLFETQPPEDVGAVTLARYRYQWEVGARTCIAMLTEARLAAILCEWHEDHVVVFTDGSVELVSVKHREPSESPWTLRGLSVEGGVAHLYQRWVGLERGPRCRIVTNGGLNTGANESAAFAAACHSRNRAAIRPFATRIVANLGATHLEDVIAFCMGLSIEAGGPGRAHIAASNIQDLMVPALRTLGMSTVNPDRPYEACVSLVESASRDQAHRMTLGAIADVRRLDTDTATSSMIGSRLVTRSMVRAATTGAITPGGFALAPTGAVQTRSKLLRKLRRGGIGPTGIRSAQRLRAVWSELEARFRADLPGATTEIEDLRTRVLAIVHSAEDELLSEGRTEPYGPALMTRVREVLRVDRIGRMSFLPIEDSHLLGLAYQLTDECQVWWSEEFDLEASGS